MPFTVSSADADRAEGNIERIMQAIAQLLEKIHIRSEVAQLVAELKETPSTVEVTELQSPQALLEGTDLNLLEAGRDPRYLSAAPPDQLEGIEQQALPASVEIQVGDDIVSGQYGDDLRATLMRLKPGQLERLRQVLAPDLEEGPVIDVAAEPVSLQFNGVPYSLESEPEKEAAAHTATLSVEEIESRTGNDFSPSPHLGDVAPVVAQVNDHGQILDPIPVKQQVESRVEDAAELDEIDAEQKTSLESPQEDASPVDTQRAAETLQQFFEMTGLDCFEGDRFVLEKQGDLMTITAKDGRGLIFAAQGEQVLSTLNSQDLAQLDQGRSVMERYAAMEQVSPSIEAPEISRTLELEID